MKIDDFLAYLFICLLCNIFAYGNAYAYKTYEYICELAYCTPQTHNQLQEKLESKEIKSNIKIQYIPYPLDNISTASNTRYYNFAYYCML